MMKNRLRIATSIALVALAALSSCSDSYPGLTYDYNGDKITNNETYDKTPVMVFVNKQNFFSVSATRGGDTEPGKGTGPFDEESILTEKYTKARFYIYAFRKEKYANDKDNDLTTEPDLTYTRLSEDRPQDEFALNCLVDGPDFNYGMRPDLPVTWRGLLTCCTKKMIRIKVARSEVEISLMKRRKKPQTLYYSSKYQNVGYNFFAYYIDSLNLEKHSVDIHNVSRTPESVAYDITIDGTQDIMCGSAPDLRADMFGVGEDKRYDINITKEERDVIINQGGGGYSTFAAHRGVYPIVDMKHQLAQLNFVAYPGDERCKDIVITGIEVVAPTRGTLTVAARDKKNIGFKPDMGAEGSFYLKEKSVDGNKCEALAPVPMKWPYDENNNKAPEIYSEREATEIGGSIMLPSQGSYYIRLHFKQMKKDAAGNDTEPQKLVATYTIEAPTADESGEKVFKKGYKYNIYIVVYGLQPIKMSASIEGWHEEKDPIIVDPDDPKYDNNPDDPNDEDNLRAE